MHDDRIADSVSDDRTTLAIAAGLVAALLGGAGWALLVNVTDYEIGWAAWGIGALVGLAMTRATARRSRGLALTAAALALVGLLAGKAFVTATSAGPIADEIAASEETLQATMAWRMYEDRSLDPATLEGLDAAQAAGDTVSDALWAEMNRQGGARLAAMSEEERHAVAEEVARNYVGQLGLVGGVRAQLSAFDALWILLALGTAFRMMDAAPVAAVEAAPEGVEPREPVA